MFYPFKRFPQPTLPILKPMGSNFSCFNVGWSLFLKICGCIWLLRLTKTKEQFKECLIPHSSMWRVHACKLFKVRSPVCKVVIALIHVWSGWAQRAEGSCQRASPLECIGLKWVIGRNTRICICFFELFWNELPEDCTVWANLQRLSVEAVDFRGHLLPRFVRSHDSACPQGWNIKGFCVLLAPSFIIITDNVLPEFFHLLWKGRLLLLLLPYGYNCQKEYWQNKNKREGTREKLNTTRDYECARKD